MQAITNTLTNTLPYLERGVAYTASLWRAGSGAVHQTAKQAVAISGRVLPKLLTPMLMAGCLPLAYLVGKDVLSLFGGYFPKNTGLIIAGMIFHSITWPAADILCNKIADNARILKTLPGGGHIYHAIQFILKSDLCTYSVGMIAGNACSGIVLSLLSDPASFFNPELLTHPLHSDLSLLYLGSNLIGAGFFLHFLLRAPATERAKADLNAWVEEAPDRQERQNRLYARCRIWHVVTYQRGKLNLSGLSLTTLPSTVWTLDWLKKLILVNNRLTTLPPQIANLAHLQNLDVENNRLRTLPEEIRSLPLTRLDMNGNPDLVLTETLHNRATLLQSIPPAPAQPDSPYQAIRDWYNQQGASDVNREMIEKWRQFEEEDNSADFTALLHHITLEAGQATRVNRSYLHGRINNILRAMTDHPNLRHQCFSLARENSATSGDQLSQAIRKLEIAYLVQQTPHDEVALCLLGRGLFHLDCLEKFTQQEYQSHGLGFREPLEMMLYHRYKLENILRLPASVKYMRFSPSTYASPGTPIHAIRYIRDEEQDKLVPFMCTLDFWRAFIQERSQAAFTYIDTETSRRLEALDEQTLGRQAYLEQRAVVRADHQKAIEFTVKNATQKIIATLKETGRWQAIAP